MHFFLKTDDKLFQRPSISWYQAINIGKLHITAEDCWLQKLLQRIWTRECLSAITSREQEIWANAHEMRESL